MAMMRVRRLRDDFCRRDGYLTGTMMHQRTTTTTTTRLARGRLVAR